ASPEPAAVKTAVAAVDPGPERNDGVVSAADIHGASHGSAHFAKLPTCHRPRTRVGTLRLVQRVQSQGVAGDRALRLCSIAHGSLLCSVEGNFGPRKYTATHAHDLDRCCCSPLCSDWLLRCLPRTPVIRRCVGTAA